MEGTANSFPGLLRRSGSAGEKGLGTMSNLASLNNTHIYVWVHRVIVSIPDIVLRKKCFT